MSFQNITNSPTNTSLTPQINATDKPTTTDANVTPMAIQTSLVTLVFLLAVIGNGGIGILLRRFKSLRTVPNILVGNLAVIDFLNATVNLPVFLAAGVLQLKHTGGRLTSATIFASQTLVIFLHLLSMFLMMLDRYIAIAWGLHYRAWKSRRKVLLAVIIVWTIVFGVTIPWTFLLYAVDHGDSAYLTYHIAYFHYVGKYNCFVTYPILGCAIGVVSALTYRSIRKQGKFYEETRVTKKGHNQLNEARQRNEVRAAQTVAITIALYVVCLIPCLMYCSLMATPKKLPKTTGEGWFVFFVVLCFYIPSALCPFIYVIRTTRFRRALVLLLRNPCGSDDFGAMSGASSTKETTASRRFEFSWKKKAYISQREPTSSTREHDSLTLETDRLGVSMTTREHPDGSENRAYEGDTKGIDRVSMATDIKGGHGAAITTDRKEGSEVNLTYEKDERKENEGCVRKTDISEVQLDINEANAESNNKAVNGHEETYVKDVNKDAASTVDNGERRNQHEGAGRSGAGEPRDKGGLDEHDTVWRG